jgi:hypothetical protein
MIMNEFVAIKIWEFGRDDVSEPQEENADS